MKCEPYSQIPLGRTASVCCLSQVWTCQTGQMIWFKRIHHLVIALLDLISALHQRAGLSFKFTIIRTSKSFATCSSFFGDCLIQPLPAVPTEEFKNSKTVLLFKMSSVTFNYWPGLLLWLPPVWYTLVPSGCGNEPTFEGFKVLLRTLLLHFQTHDTSVYFHLLMPFNPQNIQLVNELTAIHFWSEWTKCFMGFLPLDLTFLHFQQKISAVWIQQSPFPCVFACSFPNLKTEINQD